MLPPPVSTPLGGESPLPNTLTVALAGRAVDHLQRGTLALDGLEQFVLDEADRMLDMGFSKEVELLFDGFDASEVPTLLFSATQPPWIGRLTRAYMVIHSAVCVGSTLPPWAHCSRRTTLWWWTWLAAVLGWPRPWSTSLCACLRGGGPKSSKI